MACRLGVGFLDSFLNVHGEGAFGFALLCTRRLGVLFLLWLLVRWRDLTRKPPDVHGAEVTRPKTALPELSARG